MMGPNGAPDGEPPPELQQVEPFVNPVGKTKGKRSKLSQRRPAPVKAGVNPEQSINELSRDEATTHGAPPGGTNFFDPVGLNLEDSMRQGSPTLLSALKGSSLRASAYGQDFTTSFKDDDMSILGDFKNAAARFSFAGANDGFGGAGDLQSDVLWGSFPVDVDSILGGDGGMAAAGAGSTSLGAASSCCSAFFFLALGMPTPRDLPISTCSTHCTVRLSTQPLRKPSVHWS